MVATMTMAERRENIRIIVKELHFMLALVRNLRKYPVYQEDIDRMRVSADLIMESMETIGVEETDD